MKTVTNYPKTSIKRNESYVGETIEQKVHRITVNKEPINESAAEPIYTERKDGVLPDYDITTDKWEYAIDACDKSTKAWIAKREDSAKPQKPIAASQEPAQPIVPQ